MGIHGYITGVFAATGLFIEKFQLTAGLVESKRADRSRLLSTRLVDGVQEFFSRRHRQIGRVFRCNGTDELCFTGGGIELVYIDAFAGIALCIGTYEQVEVLGKTRQRAYGRKQKKDGSTHKQI